MSSPFPERPRLAEHVLARHHKTAARDLVVLIDTRDDSRYELELHEWDALSCADGTRDLDGITLAAASRGSLRRVSSLHAMLGGLHEAGLLAPGTASPRGAFDEAPPTPDDRPVEPLAGFSLTCDGAGTCCTTYGSIVFTAAEAERARVLARPDVPASWLFTPHHGSRDDEHLAVSLTSGACAFLDSSARCTVHAAGGAHAKPLGCQHYPASFTDDGVAVRVSVGLECACVARSAQASSGPPLFRGARAADLPRGTRVQRLMPEIDLHAGKLVAREALSAWTRELLTDAPRDALDGFARIASTVQERGLAPLSPSAQVAADALDVSLERALAIAGHAARALAQSGDRSHPSTHAGLAWIASAKPSAIDLVPPGALDPVEALYVRAVLHGHQALRPDVAAAMWLRASRVVLARAMARSTSDVADPGRRWFAHPIVAIETLSRALALSSSPPASPASG